MTTTIKNIDKIEMYGGFGRVDGYSRDDGYMHRGMRDGYSREEGKEYMMESLEELMESATKPAEKEALRRCMEALKRA